MEFLADVLRGISNLDWVTILTYLGSASIIVPITSYLKHKLNNKTKQKVFSIVGGLSALPVIIEQLANNSAWTAYLPDSFGWLFTTVIALHAFFLSPVWKRLLQTVQQYRQFLEYKAETDNSSTIAPIDNVNNKLNQPVSTPTPETTPKPEERPLVISG